METIGATTFTRNSSVEYLTDENIFTLFNSFNEGFIGFFSFCKGEFVWRRPNADTLRFDYSPTSGRKIDWNKIYEDNKRKFHDFDKELDKTFHDK